MITIGLAINAEQSTLPYFPPDPPSPTNPEVLECIPRIGGCHLRFTIPNGLIGGVKQWMYFATDGVTSYINEEFFPVTVSPGIAEHDFTNFNSLVEWQLSIAAVDGNGKEWWCEKDIFVTPLAAGKKTAHLSGRYGTPSGFYITTTPKSGSGAGDPLAINEALTDLLITE